ncbi:MAG: glycosyltransferase family 4 protein [Chthoniobacterales bacterium]
MDDALTIMQSPAEPLRILAIVNLPWDARLGASRVWIELTKEWTRAGHIVEKYCLTDAFPDPPASRAGSALRQILFPHTAAAFVRTHGHRFDVIDCLIGVLPFSKNSLRFQGLLVARSVGLFRIYNRFLRESAKLEPSAKKGRWFGHLFHRLIDWRARVHSEKSLHTSDLLNLPNEDERRELSADPSVRVPAIVEPYGLSDEFFETLAAAAAPPAQRLQGQKVCFIGMWGPRKGSLEWPRIMTAIWAQHPATEFIFLGTMFEEAVVRADLGFADDKRISCQPTFSEGHLPSLLADCAIGIFPSHIEGFGLAVIEQLAAGLPTIAYDVPGPRQILQKEVRLLTPVGDVEAIAARALELLSLPLDQYEALSASCLEIARRFRWPKIAQDTIGHYRIALSSLGRAATDRSES